MKSIIEHFIIGFKESWQDFCAPVKWVFDLLRKYLWPK